MWCATHWCSGLLLRMKSTAESQVTKELQLRNRQRDRALNIDFLLEISRALVEEELGLGAYELGISFISPAKMAELNQQYLKHDGSTDVITFDYREGYEEGDEGTPLDLAGEIYISV